MPSETLFRAPDVLLRACSRVVQAHEAGFDYCRDHLSAQGGRRSGSAHCVAVDMLGWCCPAEGSWGGGTRCAHLPLLLPSL